MGTRVDEALSGYLEALAYLELIIAPDVESKRQAFRHAVILEGANVPCELVRDGGG